MGRRLYEAAQCSGRRSSSSRRETSFGSAFRRDSTTLAEDLWLVYCWRGLNEEKHTLPFTACLMNGKLGLLCFGVHCLLV
jgi:hypothetical protein